jgi:hypothetical protein
MKAVLLIRNDISTNTAVSSHIACVLAERIRDIASELFWDLFCHLYGGYQGLFLRDKSAQP